MTNYAACTIIAKNYLSHARVLSKSFLKYHPDSKFFVLVVDDFDNYFDPGKEVFETVKASSLDIKDFNSFCFKYNITELCTAVKPYFLEYLYKKYNLQKIIYLDPDILVMNKLNKLFELLDKHSIILTPHITSPFNDCRNPSENFLLKAGVYNLGFIGTSNTIETNNFLKWWQDKLYDDCRISLNEGLFVDQKWADFVPCFCDKVETVRDPEYNIAYWNLHERKIKKEGGNYLVNNKPVGFFHFSGLPLDDLNKLSKHQDRFKLDDFKDLPGLFQFYKNLLIENGYPKTKEWPYAYNYFDNGFEISNTIRQVYTFLGRKEAKRFKNPFATKFNNSFFNWLDLKKYPQTKSENKEIKNSLSTNYIFKLENDSFIKKLYQIFLFRIIHRDIQEKYEFQLKNKIPKELIWFDVAGSKEAKEKKTAPDKFKLYSIFISGIIKAIPNQFFWKNLFQKLHKKDVKTF